MKNKKNSVLSFIEHGSTDIPNLLLDNFDDLGMSNTELILYIQIKKEQGRGISFPSMKKLASLMSISEKDLYKVLQSLQTKKLMEIDQFKNDQNQIIDFYNFKLLYIKLSESLFNEEKILEDFDNTNSSNSNTKQLLFDQIQLEFGRSLSPIELETINAWIKEDKYNIELIKASLKEAVLNQVYSLKYMDRILIDWDKKNIKTLEQVQAHISNNKNKFYNPKNNTQPKNNSDNTHIPILKITK